MGNSLVLSEEEAIELLAFLVTAARCLLDEPVDYGPLRLLRAAELLCRRVEPRSSEERRQIFRRLAEEIPPNMARRQGDPAGYLAFLDASCRLIAGELMRATGRGV
ncbi:MAG: hypothetical protein HY660_03465 [Armatimonadetes bacterium]|nr:hypothetical protein [Armatimonadota bacterium]